MNPIMQAIMFNGLKYALKQLKAYMATQDFVEIADKVLDKVEDYFNDNVVMDTAVELVTAEIREYFSIPDGND